MRFSKRNCRQQETPVPKCMHSSITAHWSADLNAKGADIGDRIEPSGVGLAYIKCNDCGAVLYGVRP